MDFQAFFAYKVIICKVGSFFGHSLAHTGFQHSRVGKRVAPGLSVNLALIF